MITSLPAATQLASGWKHQSQCQTEVKFKYRNMITVLNRWPLDRIQVLMCIHDCQGKEDVKEKVRPYCRRIYTHIDSHKHYRVVNLSFDGLTLSYHCEEEKKNKSKVTLVITLTAPLRLEREEEKLKEAFSVLLPPFVPFVPVSRLAPWDTIGWET